MKGYLYIIFLKAVRVARLRMRLPEPHIQTGL